MMRFVSRFLVVAVFTSELGLVNIPAIPVLLTSLRTGMTLLLVVDSRARNSYDRCEKPTRLKMPKKAIFEERERNGLFRYFS